MAMPEGTYRYPNIDRVLYGRFFATAPADERARQAWVAEVVGLPTTLRDVGVCADQFDSIAEGAMHDRMVPSNPHKIEGPATVRQLLDAAC